LADIIFFGQTPLPRLGDPLIQGNEVIVRISNGRKLKLARLLYALDKGKWNDRKWNMLLTRNNGIRLRQVFHIDTKTFFFATIDEAGAHVSNHIRSIGSSLLVGQALRLSKV